MKRYTINQIKKKLDKLKGERGLWEDYWQEVVDFIFPRRGMVTGEKSKGARPTFRLLDNTGVQSNELLAGMLHGLLTNPDVLWFELTTGDVRLDNNDEVRTWFQQVVKQIHTVLNNTNFQTEVAEMYLDITSFGTGCQHIEESDEHIVRFLTYFIKQYYIEENNKGEVASLYREWKWKPSDLVSEFGMAVLPEKILKLFKDGKDDEICVIHACYPAKAVDLRVVEDEIYISQYVLPEYDHEVKWARHDSFPYVVPRWSKASGESWGRSPGMNALPEMRVLNKMNETMLIGAQKMVDPPMQLPDDGFVMPFITRPGGMNFYRAGSTDRAEPLFKDTRIDFGFQAMEDRRQRVRDAFYVDQLKLRQGGPMMTATEVMQRTEEAMRLLGPMLGRMHNEYLKPMVERVYKIMLKRNKLPPVPPALDGKPLTVKYSSMIAKAQRMSDVQNITRTLEIVAPYLQLDPAAAQNFNVDNVVRIVSNMLGVPQEIIRKATEVQQRREQEAQQKQQLEQEQMASMQMQNANMGVEAMKGMKEIQRG